MSTVLKNVLAFTSLAPGGTIVLAHGLNYEGIALQPDYVAFNIADVTVSTVNASTITIINNGAASVTGRCFVERYHSYDRAIPEGLDPFAFPFVSLGGAPPTAGGPPSGAAGGDLGSNYPAPSVIALTFGGTRLTLDTAPNNGEALVRSGTGITGSPGLPPSAHALGGAAHTADTLANLNSKVTDANLDDSTSTRPPTLHDFAGADHNPSTLANVNTKVSDATLDDSGASRPPQSHALGGSAHSADTLANLNSKVSDATLDDSGASRPPQSHALGGAAHSADTLANLNSKVSDATLDDITGSRPPAAHALGGAAHSADTLANLNSKVSDATLDDITGSRPPAAHALGGAAHSADTLANLNSKVSDATLDDASAARPPQSHALGGAAHSADTLANLNSKVSDATLDDVGDPRDADALIETGGPTTLAIGAIADTEFLVRSGGTITSSPGGGGGAPNPHALGGAVHSADTLANLNSKVSDATLDDSGASRPPQSHALGGAAHSADTLANLNTKVSDATLDDVGDPRDADALIETGGPTTLAIAGIANGEVLVRSGGTITSQAAGGSVPLVDTTVSGGAVQFLDATVAGNTVISVRFELIVVAPASGLVLYTIRPNGVVPTAAQNTRALSWTINGSASVSGNLASVLRIGQTDNFSGTQNLRITGTMNLATGVERFFNSRMSVRRSTGLAGGRDYAGLWDETATAITSLRFQSDSASGFQNGSRLRVWML